MLTVAALRLFRQPALRHGLFVVFGVAGFYLLSRLFTADNQNLTQVGIYVIALGGLTVLVGTNGQISLGQGAFMAIGAYTAGLLLEHTSIPFGLALVAAAAVSTLAGAIVGRAATRLRGPYLAGLTLTIAFAVPGIADQWPGFFGGEQGFAVNPPTPPRTVDPAQYLSWVTLAGALITLFLLANFMRSRFGRALRAVRDDEIAASLSGIRVVRTKVLAFGLSSGCAGLAGGYFALFLGYVAPAYFSVELSVALLAGIVIGGTGSLIGVWWGAVLIVYLPQWATTFATHFNLNFNLQSNLEGMIYGAVLILVMMLAPGGIQGGLRAIGHRTVTVLFGRPQLAPSTSGLTANQPVPARQTAGGNTSDT